MGRFDISDSSTDSFDPTVEDPNYEPDEGPADQSDNQDDPDTISLRSLENMLDSIYRLFYTFLKSSSYLIFVAQQVCLNVGVACGCLYTAAHIVKVSDADEMKAAFLISLQGGIEACVRIPFGYLADRNAHQAAGSNSKQLV